MPLKFSLNPLSRSGLAMYVLLRISVLGKRVLVFSTCEGKHCDQGETRLNLSRKQGSVTLSEEELHELQRLMAKQR